MSFPFQGAHPRAHSSTLCLPTARIYWPHWPAEPESDLRVELVAELRDRQDALKDLSHAIRFSFFLSPHSAAPQPTPSGSPCTALCPRCRCGHRRPSRRHSMHIRLRRHLVHQLHRRSRRIGRRAALRPREDRPRDQRRAHRRVGHLHTSRRRRPTDFTACSQCRRARAQTNTCTLFPRAHAHANASMR